MFFEFIVSNNFVFLLDNRNGNFGTRNRRNDNNLSAEQLDAELDEMRAARS